MSPKYLISSYILMLSYLMPPWLQSCISSGVAKIRVNSTVTMQYTQWKKIKRLCKFVLFCCVRLAIGIFSSNRVAWSPYSILCLFCQIARIMRIFINLASTSNNNACFSSTKYCFALMKKCIRGKVIFFNSIKFLFLQHCDNSEFHVFWYGSKLRNV